MNDSFISKGPSEFVSIRTPAISEDVEQRDKKNFELGVREGIGLPIYVIVGIQQEERLNNQLIDIDSFYRPRIIFAQCKIGSEKEIILV